MSDPTNAGAELLRRWLDEQNLSQTEAAAVLGVTQPAVSQWTRGVSRPDPHLRRAIAAITAIPETSWETADERAQVERAVNAARERSATEAA